MLRVIIADDHALFREGLKSLLKLHPEVSVVGEAEMLAVAQRTRRRSSMRPRGTQ